MTEALVLELDLTRTPPGVELRVGAAEPLPGGPGGYDAWVHRTLAPARGALVTRGAWAVTTAAGWPITAIRTDVVEDGAVAVPRLHAFCAVDELGIVVTAIGAVDAAREALLALLATAAPRHGRPVVALAQVWD